MKSSLAIALLVCASSLLFDVAASESTGASTSFDLHRQFRGGSLFASSAGHSRPRMNLDLSAKRRVTEVGPLLCIPGLFPSPRVGRRSMRPEIDFSTFCEAAPDRSQICCDPNVLTYLARSSQSNDHMPAWSSQHSLDSDSVKK